MTYLEIVNKVLLKLRENTVTSVSETPHSQLIGELVNDVKTEMEEAWNWEGLRTIKTVLTVNGTSNYTITGTNSGTRLLDIWNNTEDFFLKERPRDWFVSKLRGANPTTGEPFYYAINGRSSSGELNMDVYPIPDQEYSIQVNCVVPQAELSLDSTEVLISGDIIAEGVVARAISERGDDGGFMEQEQRFRSRLSDAISIEAGRHSTEIIWGAC